MSDLDEGAAPVHVENGSSSALADANANVFSILAQRAGSRSSAELWTTTLGGSVNAGFIWMQHPSLHWLGAGCAAVAAYGIWGLADRAIETRPAEREYGVGFALLRATRALAVPVGIVAAISAVGIFMAVALGGWIH
jgi:GNAT superfamily N-acetyltransferase